MDITIIIERHGIRSATTVNSESTRIPGVHRTRWVGPRSKDFRDYHSLTHVFTGRALNCKPLTMDDSERLIDALMDCPVEWEWIVDGRTGMKFYSERLTEEAKRLAGVE